MRIRSFAPLLVLPLLLAACAEDALVYRAAIERAAVHRPADEIALKPLAYPVDGATLTVSTAWASPSVGKELTLTRDSWITLEPEVRERCRAWPPSERVARLHKLLGLKPAQASDAGSSFVLMTVEKPQPIGPAGIGVFRPCPNPDPTATSCGNTFTGSGDYAKWFVGQALSSYVEGADMGATGYPWTRAGFTYDWNDGADPRHGPGEYVVPKGTTVRIRAVVPVDRYCG